jgi:hypothetical protein
MIDAVLCFVSRTPRRDGMMINPSARRLLAVAAPIVGGALAVTVACTSTTAGHPGSSGGAPARTSATPSLSSASLPSVSVSVPALGGSQFCTDLGRQGNLGNLSGGARDVTKVLAAWDRLAAEAPAEIRPDVQAIADFLHAELSGRIDPSATQKLGTAAANIGRYVATHCR